MVRLLYQDTGLVANLNSPTVSRWNKNPNLVHHKATAIVVGVAGMFFANNYLILAGLILFGHSSMDRMLGYGLKYTMGFKFTHLGEVGAQQKPEQAIAVD